MNSSLASKAGAEEREFPNLGLPGNNTTHTFSARLCQGRAGGMTDVSLLWVLFREKEMLYHCLMSKIGEKISSKALGLCFTEKL